MSIVIDPKGIVKSFIMRYPEIEMEYRPESEIKDNEPDAVEKLLAEYENGNITKEVYLEQIRLLINTDHLTGLLNKRGLVEALNKEIRTYQRNNHLNDGIQPTQHKPPLILLVDSDQLKAINDLHGHPAGDEAIQLIGRVISTAALRPTDSIGRFGKGDEFMAILSETDIPGAMIVAERARQNVEQAAQHDSRFAGLSVSIGIAFCLEGITTDELIKQADAAMYMAKKGGRNCIAIHPACLPQEDSALSDLNTFIQDRGIKALPIRKPEAVATMV